MHAVVMRAVVMCAVAIRAGAMRAVMAKATYVHAGVAPNNLGSCCDDKDKQGKIEFNSPGPTSLAN